MAQYQAVPNQHLPLNILKKYLIYTASSPVPQIWETIATRRCLLRIVQLLVAAGKRRDLFQGAFATIFYTSIAYPQSSLIVYKSGVTMMVFTSVIGFFVASTYMIVQLFPQHLNVSPDRHLRFSMTEISFDLILIGLWIATSSVLLFSGNECRTDMSGDGCIYIYSSTGLGYFNAVLFAFSMLIGIRDSIQNNKSAIIKSKDHVMFARGNWKR